MSTYILARRDEDEGGCGVNPIDALGLRIGAIFVLLASSTASTLFPIVTKRFDRLRRAVPATLFEFAKFCGSGIILSTAIIHLLEPAADEQLGPASTISMGGCVPDSWNDYPWAFALCLFSLFATFVVELFAFRVGTSYLKKQGIAANYTCGPCRPTAFGATIPETSHTPSPEETVAPSEVEQKARLALSRSGKDPERGDGKGDEDSIIDLAWTDSSEQEPVGAQLLGVIILEFGILFHSLIIGMTMALSAPGQFETLFIVIIFHQMFEGLGLGTRLAFLRLPLSWSWAPMIGGLMYSCITPLGMAIGLGTRESLSMSGATATITTGILNSISAGILLYAATVELIAHELIFNTHYHTCSSRRVLYVLASFAFGAGVMSLLVSEMGMKDHALRESRSGLHVKVAEARAPP